MTRAFSAAKARFSAVSLFSFSWSVWYARSSSLTTRVARSVWMRERIYARMSFGSLVAAEISEK
jgi:hypothetical protein